MMSRRWIVLVPLFIGCSSTPPPEAPDTRPDAAPELDSVESTTGSVLRAVAHVDRLSSGSDEEEQPHATLPPLCPFDRPGAHAVVSSDGVKVVLVLSAADALVAQRLRQAARDMPELVFLDGDESYGTYVAVEDRPDGVALTFTPVDPGERDEVMELLKEQAERLPAGDC